MALQAARPGLPRRLGLAPQEIADAVDYGVIKMNVDTDTQYAFTRPVADWMLKNYDGVLKVDGEVGNKKQYDPRAWGKEAEGPWPPASSRPARTCARPA
jgi:fructose/tagatose bisphosphate aldolase